GAAIGAETPDATRWDRKNYFYPDLPKGYQISQYDLPLAAAGTLTFDTSDGPVTVRITRAHLEEDTAKLVHAEGPGGQRLSLVDFNRSGVPLMEIVTEPDIRTAEQARRYAEELQLLLRTIGWSDERGETYHMRSKETSDDYRYFPEPDLPPLRVDAAWLAQVRGDLPELPAARRARYRDALGLSAYDAAVLVADADAGWLFEAT